MARIETRWLRILANHFEESALGELKLKGLSGSLTLGSVASQDKDSIDITGGTIGGNTAINTTGTIKGSSLETTSDVVIGGDLTVNGTTVTLNAETWQVKDKNIVLGNTDTPTDITADGGGITLKSNAGDKTIIWDNFSGAWEFNQDVNLAAGKHFLIGGKSVVNEFALNIYNSSGVRVTGLTVDDGLEQMKSGDANLISFGSANPSDYSRISWNDTSKKVDFRDKNNALLTIDAKIAATNLVGKVPLANLPTGTTAAHVSLGNHNHDSTYFKISGGNITGNLNVKNKPVATEEYVNSAIVSYSTFNQVTVKLPLDDARPDVYMAAKYIILPETPVAPGEVALFIHGAPYMDNGKDFTVIENVGEWRLSWSGLELDGLLVEDDDLTIVYEV